VLQSGQGQTIHHRLDSPELPVHDQLSTFFLPQGRRNLDLLWDKLELSKICIFDVGVAFLNRLKELIVSLVTKHPLEAFGIIDWPLKHFPTEILLALL